MCTGSDCAESWQRSPAASFADMRYAHFLASAVAVGSVFHRAAELSVGELVLEAVRATRAQVSVNTNLGTLLLFAPLAKAACRGMAEPDVAVSNRSLSSALEKFASDVAEVLASLTAADSEAVYEAIRIANPGGLGQQSENDVRSAAPADLIGAMEQAAAVDGVARQYVNRFADVLGRMLAWFDAALSEGMDTLQAICAVQLRLLAEEPDGLIVRKCGLDVARQVQSLAQRVVQESDAVQRKRLVEQLDDFLRSDGHRRNPGTSADLIAAMLFARLLVC